MKQQDIRTLKILEEIENGQAPSQRYLAGKLNVSLGLTNSFIKRLARKGFFKITTIPKNRVKYIITPKGAAEKTRLTYEYIQASYQFYKNARKKLRTIFNDFVLNGVKRIAFYGATDFAEIAYISLQETHIELAAVIDDSKSGEIFFRREVSPPEFHNLSGFDRILITDPDSCEKIRDFLINKGVSEQNIVLMN